ncbi:hypothetical protein BOTNAR_0068g00070 [Botryotinia narcissicola]|uniref:Uncharacterized protein n=1 Tax=Botryotinia narcissicola TaxID=278944 RepID=A0A4Z1IXN3_9HELO|nr:hypothetical protein BOTNAR_0068g00070 [Botryotinia narcissicola]
MLLNRSINYTGLQGREMLMSMERSGVKRALTIACHLTLRNYQRSGAKKQKRRHLSKLRNTKSFRLNC